MNPLTLFSRSSRTGALILVVLLPLACSSAKKVRVSSTPPGARILINSTDSGQTTPAEVTLSSKEDRYEITLEKHGYNPVTREVRLTTDVRVIDPDEVAVRICCAPCCLGLPLLGLLKPLRVDKEFVPTKFNANLYPEGQGIKLDVMPRDAEIYVDGRLQRPLDGSILIMEPGDREIEVVREGYKPYVRILHIHAQRYQDLVVNLAVEGQGILLTTWPEGAKVYVDEQYQGTAGAEERRIRTEPGPHSLQVELEGYQTWTDIVSVAADEFKVVNLKLKLAGQGLIIHKPQGLRRGTSGIQILVGGAIHATSFETPIPLPEGEHHISIQIPGYQTWESRIHITTGTYLELAPVMKRGNR